MYNLSEFKENFAWAVAILEDNMEGMNSEEKYEYIQDVNSHGCASGVVSGVIYYAETKDLFKENIDDVLFFLEDYRREYGFNIAEEYGFEHLYNKSIWMIVESVANAMLEEMEQLQDDGLIY